VLLFEARSSASLAEVFIASLTLAILIFLPRFTRKMPAPLVALPVAAVVAALLEGHLPNFTVATIGSRFQTTVLGQLFHGIPQLPPLPIVPWLAEGPGGQIVTL